MKGHNKRVFAAIKKVANNILVIPTAALAIPPESKIAVIIMIKKIDNPT